LRWNEAEDELEIGVTTISLPNCPLNMAGSGNTYIQAALQNRSTGANAQADFVLTADIGNDTNYFVDLGINNTSFSNTGYQLYKPYDGFLYNRGGDMHLGAAASGKVVKVHVGGIQSGNLVATFTSSGINIETGRHYYSGGINLNQIYATQTQLSNTSGVLNTKITAPLSKSTTFFNPDGIPTGVYIIPMWRATTACTITGIHGYILSGTNAIIGVHKNNMAADVTTGDLTIAATGAWYSSGIINANGTFAQGDTLMADIASVRDFPVSVTIQVDFSLP
jgi:hypothetical protein